MRRSSRVIAVTIAVLALGVGAARAITYGTPDGDGHPYVVLVALYSNGAYQGRCSGSLLSPTVVLTAAHCIGELDADTARVFVASTVTEDLRTAVGGVVGRPIPHPAFTDLSAVPNTSDVAVIRLAAPLNVARYALFAPVGALDTLDGTQVIAVGFGVQAVKPKVLEEKTRYFSSPTVTRLDGKLTAGWNVETSSSKKGGGTCFGDSGGPLLLPGSDAVVAVVSFGKNTTCKGHDYGYRVDTTYAQTWLAGVLAG
jgi:secreted trypsin-like serine protease